MQSETASGPGDLVDVFGVELELGAQEIAHARGGAVVHLEADGRAETAPPHVFGDGAQEVARFLLADFDVGVPRDAEGGGAADLHAGEEVRQVRFDEILEQQEFGRPRGVAGQGDEARQRRRHLDAREGDPPVVLLGQLDGEREREVRDERERMGRVECEGRQNRKDHALEIGGQLLAPFGVDVGPAHDADPRLGEARQQLVVQDRRGPGEIAANRLADGGELLVRREPVGDFARSPRLRAARAGPRRGS